MSRSGRLSTLQAAFVVARRDFSAILFSKAFIFFLLGPLFPLIVGILAGGVGQNARDTAEQPELGIAMQAADIAAMQRAYRQLEPQIGGALPKLVVLKALTPNEPFDAESALGDSRRNLAAVLTGTPTNPKLTGSEGLIARWRGPMAMVAAEAGAESPSRFPEIALSPVSNKTSADNTRGRYLTAQSSLMLLFLLMMMLAGMVLSNLVEEKGNKIIEVLAAAIPMDAVFLGKLFAMLAISMVGIAVWGTVGATGAALTGRSLSEFATPAVGWPLFFSLAVAYFATGYLILGSLFLAIGAQAKTVREVQTLSMPVTFVQLFVFFFAIFAMSQPGSPIELAAILFPLSSPFAMLARAAQDGAIWPHALALGWQVVCVALMVRAGAVLFRKRVMQSGNAGSTKRSLWQRATNRG